MPSETLIGKHAPVQHFTEWTQEQEAAGIQAIKDRRSLIYNCIVERGVTFDWDEKEQRIVIKPDRGADHAE